MPEDPGLAIRLRGVRKSFGPKTVLDGIDLDVRRGEIMVVMGGSGSGKSTTLRMMIGSIPADEGEIRLLGEDICGLEIARLNDLRKQIGVLFQSGALFNSMTIAQNVALPLIEHTDLDPEIVDIQVKIKLEQVGLREHASKYPAEISGGMKKRAGLARALALDPKIIFYDEPSAGLDPVTSAEIDRLILDLTKKLGVTGVVITHEMDSAFTIADRMAMLDRGRLLAVESRQWFDDLRSASEQEAAEMNEQQQLIRQFLRGDADGPITQRRAQSNFAEDLFGLDIDDRPARPSVQATRRG